MMVTSGIIIRQAVKAISPQSTGVRVQRLDEDDAIVALVPLMPLMRKSQNRKQGKQGEFKSRQSSQQPDTMSLSYVIAVASG